MTTPMIPSPTGLYKVLGPGLTPCNGGTGTPYLVGKRRAVRGELIPCQRGIHVCTPGQLVQWLGPAIHPVLDASDERVEESDKAVLRWAVLGEAYPSWNERTARLFACDCAEHTLPIFERHHLNNDSRPRDALAVARRFADGQASREELAAARAAAWAAAAAAAVAWNAERSWQTQRLMHYLSGEES